jgi:hypothetical protein
MERNNFVAGSRSPLRAKKSLGEKIENQTIAYKFDDSRNLAVYMLWSFCCAERTARKISA